MWVAIFPLIFMLYVCMYLSEYIISAYVYMCVQMHTPMSTWRPGEDI